MKRFIEFDVLRGVLLLMMSVDHSPSSLRRFTDQPLGFFSTAECFVFVSAFLAGMLLAVSLGRRAVYRAAFSGKQGPAADASFATTALSPLGDRVSFLALDFYHERPRSNYSNMVVR
jgi:hypothetical protein